MKIEITITQEIIKKSLMCGVQTDFNVNTSLPFVSSNCAFAVALKELIPQVTVGVTTTCYYDRKGIESIGMVYNTPEQVTFIVKFDTYCKQYNYMERWELVGQKFLVEIPDEVVKFWYQDRVDEVQEILDKSTSLKTVGGVV